MATKLRKRLRDAPEAATAALQHLEAAEAFTSLEESSGLELLGAAFDYYPDASRQPPKQRPQQENTMVYADLSKNAPEKAVRLQPRQTLRLTRERGRTEYELGNEAFEAAGPAVPLAARVSEQK